MGLIYVSSDSSTLINALKANIKSGKEASEQLKSGSQKIISAVDGKTLSGAAYTAGKGLFSDLIIPTISKVSASVDELETELTKYISADQQVSGEGTLDQEKIERKIEQKKAMKSAVEVSLAAVKAASRSNPLTKIVDATLHVQSSLTNMSNSYEDDIRELEKKLEKLHQFSSTTSALFSNGLSNLKLAMQSVTILNNTIVYPDGTYQLPAGIALSWFDQLKAQDGTNVHNEDKQPDVGNREYKLIDLGYGKLWMWVEKGKNYATSEDIDVTLAYNEWVSRMIDKYGTSFLLGEHQEDFFETFLRQNATLVKELSTGIDSVTGKPLTKQDRLLKMTTLANSMLTAGVAVKGVVDVGKTTTVKKASGAVDDISWSLNKNGATINGRKYSGHALERMAPDTPDIRAQLHTRAQEIAKGKGYVPGTREYSDFIKKYVQPRNVPPSVIEDAIKNGVKTAGNQINTWKFETGDVTVIINNLGDVITVIPK